MNDRKKFIRSIQSACTAFGVEKADGTTEFVLPASFKDGEIPTGCVWQTTIFCQFTNPHLASSIGRSAKDLSCDIFNGEPFSADIFAVPYFVAIVDRNTVGKERWAEYLEYRKEVDGMTPYILVDELGDSEGWGVDEHMEILDPKNQDHVRYIIDRILESHRVAQDWEVEDLLS